MLVFSFFFKVLVFIVAKGSRDSCTQHCGSRFGGIGTLIVSFACQLYTRSTLALREICRNLCLFQPAGYVLGVEIKGKYLSLQCCWV